MILLNFLASSSDRLYLAIKPKLRQGLPFLEVDRADI